MKKVIFSFIIILGLFGFFSQTQAEEISATTPDIVAEETTSTEPIVEEPVVEPPAEIVPEIIDETTLKNDAKIILNYFKSIQESDGKIVNANISDWTVTAFAANQQYVNQIKKPRSTSLFKYILDYDFDEASDLNICATYPRHILALLASGVDKASARPIELNSKLIDTCYKNNLFGENGINDDVFALFSLLAMDTDPTSPIIVDIINTIIGDQQPDGSFTWAGYSSADITGAVINVLVYAQQKNISVNQEIINDAKNYLKNQQLADGGWGYGSSDVLTTSWTIMGLNALGEGQSEWTNSTGKNPWGVLHNLINPNGYYESNWSPGEVDWFATKHAVPALLGQSWPIIMDSQEEETSISNGGNNNLEIIVKADFPELFGTTSTLEEIVTTTFEMATTTLEVVTSTLQLVISTLELTTNTFINYSTTTTEIITTSTQKKLLIKQIKPPLAPKLNSDIIYAYEKTFNFNSFINPYRSWLFGKNQWFVNYFNRTSRI